MPEGNYKLEDGTSFTTDETGLVTEVSEAEEVDAEDDDEDDMGKDKDKEYMSDNAELFAEVGSVVKELLEEVRKDISRISSELDELRGENLAKDENIVDLQKENTELSSQLEKLGNEPSEKPVNTSKFATNTNPRVELSRADYAKLTAQEKYMYNLNN
jgi:molybdopterin converting factor small subunit